MKPFLKFGTFGVLMLMLATSLFGQRQVATFEDGTKIEYEVLSDRPEDRPQLTLYWGGFASVVIEGLRAEYRIPQKAILSLQTNLFGASLYGNTADSLFANNTPPAARSFRLRGTYILSSKDKPKTMGLSLKSESDGYETTVYQLERDVPRTYQWGVRAGIGYRNTDLIGLTDYGLLFTEAALGVGFTRARNIAIMTSNGKGKPRLYKGSSQMSAYADALFFLGTQPARLEEQVRADEDNAEFSPVGMEVGLEGRTTFWGKRSWGFFGGLGFLKAPNRSTMTYCFGLHFGFNDNND